MPSLHENISAWDNYNWSEAGDEWSTAWGSTDLMWYRSILPRIISYLPAQNILEIAPGYGRCTAYLQSMCDQIWIVDVTQRCIDACKERFINKSHIHYILNDGVSLEMLPDNTFDFVFSWDSLVHCDRKVIESYLTQLRKKMTFNGIGFIHHSNAGALVLEDFSELKGSRSTDITASLFESLCNSAHLKCCTQEIVPWSSDKQLTDCFSVFTTLANENAPQNKTMINHDFVKEFETSRMIDSAYNFTSRKVISYLNTPKSAVEILNNMSDKRIIGWGGGDYFIKCQMNYPLPITYLVDKDPRKIGTTIMNLEVKSIEALSNEHADDIFIIIFSPAYHRHIYRWLDIHNFRFVKHYCYLVENELKLISSQKNAQ